MFFCNGQTEDSVIGLMQRIGKLGICRAVCPVESGFDTVRVLAPRIYEGGGKSSAHWYRGEFVACISFTKSVKNRAVNTERLIT